MQPTSRHGRHILAYLAEHPQAQDSLEGILDWWITQRLSKVGHSVVKAALDELMDAGMLRQHRLAGGSVTYGLNPAFAERVKAMKDADEVDL